MRWVGLLPLRGGSKSIPGKNLRSTAGRPLYAWSLEAALESQCFDRIYVASDSTALREDARARFGNRIEVIDRAAENATDTASSESVMLELLSSVECDVLTLLQATSPLTSVQDFRAARERFQRDGLDSLLTGVETTRFFWSREGRPLNYDPAKRPRRQEFAGSVMENGAFYMTRSSLLIRTGSRLGGRIGVHVMSPESAVEIDEPSDWSIVEALLRKQHVAARDVRMLVVDVDGTLTDGGMYYSGEGEALKKFNTRDAKGMLMLRDAGVRVCVLTAENSAVVHARMKKLGIADYFPGVGDKLTWLRQVVANAGIDMARVAYVGDDLNDLECLRAAGLSCCPADAVPEIRRVVRYVCNAAGGEGAVREVCDLIRAQREERAV
jgi:N-acylneuraminate cytidylyltransferase